MSRYHIVSLLIHIIIIIIFAWWPSFFVSHIQEENSINVHLVAISELTNLKKIEQTKKNSKKPETASSSAPPAPSKQSQDTPVKPSPTAEKKPEPSKEINKAEVIEKEKNKSKQPIKPDIDAKPSPQKKPEAKKEEKKTKTKNPSKPITKNNTKPKEDSNFSEMMLKTLEESNATKREKQKKADDVAQMAEKMFSDTEKLNDRELPLSIAEKDSIRDQISNNWITTSFAGAENAGMFVTLRINIDLDGNVTDIKVLKETNSNPVYSVFVESTIRAVKKSSPLQNLPREKFNTWRETEMRFDSNGSIS
jgi:outer membrane biosynthesis protein TonB